jgi:hypothetical protein
MVLNVFKLHVTGAYPASVAMQLVVILTDVLLVGIDVTNGHRHRGVRHYALFQVCVIYTAFQEFVLCPAFSE